MSDSGLSLSSKGKVLRPSGHEDGKLPFKRNGDSGDSGKRTTQKACALCPKFQVPGPGVGCEDCEAME